MLLDRPAVNPNTVFDLASSRTRLYLNFLCSPYKLKYFFRFCGKPSSSPVSRVNPDEPENSSPVLSRNSRRVVE